MSKEQSLWILQMSCKACSHKPQAQQLWLSIILNLHPTNQLDQDHTQYCTYSLRESLKKDKKKGNTNHVCVDYQRLNKLTVFDPEPMPTAEHLFQKLNGDKYFTRIDLSKGYWQVSIPEEDIPKTAFVTPDRSYKFLKMPFGMINSTATLKRAMKKLLHGLENVEFYWDDILASIGT